MSEDIISREECAKIVEKELGTRDFKNLGHEVERLSGVSGYLGDYFKITITATYNERVETFCLFAKTLPETIDALKDLAINSQKKEEFFYNKYFEMLRSNGFANMLDFAPKFYFSRPDDIIVLENLVASGYQSVDLYELPNYDLMKHFIRNLAKLHACSLLLEEAESLNRGKTFRMGEEFPEYLRDYLFSNQESDNEISKVSMDTIAEYIIDKFPEIPKKFSMEEFRNKLQTLKDEMLSEGIRASKKYRNVLSHGDAWLPNILVKKDASGKIISCLLLDFQLIRYNPPVIDLTFAIYLCTDKTFRRKYLKQLLKDYHNELSISLENYGYDINKLFDFATFLDSFYDLKATGIGIALCYGQIMLIPKEKLKKLQDDKARNDRFFNQNRVEFLESEHIWDDCNYRSRIRELVEDMYESFADSK